MKKLLYLFVLGLMASCSSPKYAANFNYYKSNSGYAGGYGELKTKETIIAPIEPSKLIASIDEKMIILEETPAANEVRKTYIQMNKTERKALRQYLKKEMKTMGKVKKTESVESVSGTKALENDLKLAAIFGAVGIVGLILGGVSEVFWIIGAIALLIGVVFFVKWLVRQ